MKSSQIKSNPIILIMAGILVVFVVIMVVSMVADLTSGSPSTNETAGTATRLAELPLQSTPHTSSDDQPQATVNPLFTPAVATPPSPPSDDIQPTVTITLPPLPSNVQPTITESSLQLPPEIQPTITKYVLPPPPGIQPTITEARPPDNPVPPP